MTTINHRRGIIAKIDIKHVPQVTKDSLMESFHEHFKGKYEVYMTKVIDRDFVVKKSGMSGVFLKLKQKDGKTQVVYNRNAPSALFRGLLGIIMLLFVGRDVMQDVKTYLETMRYFKQMSAIT